MTNANRTRHLIDRLARLNASDTWSRDLNPTQSAALSYLGRANQFSRSPSHVADYLGSTRGTVSQTLKALTRKGLIATEPAALDRRSIHYSITATGADHLSKRATFEQAATKTDLTTLNQALTTIIHALLAQNGGRTFGLCRTCKHHQIGKSGAHCALLDVPLTEPEADQICHEHAA